MACVVHGGKRAAIDPLKHSQPLGGALVFLGLAEAMPVLHGSKGCASFAKALLTRHFREAVSLQTTAVTEVASVLGAEDLMMATLDALAAGQRPQVIGLLTTGLTEVSGQDVEGDLRGYRERAGDGGPLVVGVSTPDFRGGLSDGYAAALEALLRAVPLDEADDAGPPAGPEPLALLVGPTLTAVDLDELRETVVGLGFDPIVVPDLSGSLDGHLADAWSPVPTGGTTLADLRRLGSVRHVVSIGVTTAAAAAALAGRIGAEVLHHPHVTGLAATDDLVGELLEHAPGAGTARREVPASLRRDRARLADGLLDAHFMLSGARVALALEPDQLLGVARLLSDLGAEIVAAVSPTASPALEQVPAEEVVIGDLEDLEQRAREAGASLVLGSSHARATAHRIGAGHLAIGFPVFDRLGAQQRGGAGYRGSLRLLIDTANALLDHEHTGDILPI